MTSIGIRVVARSEQRVERAECLLLMKIDAASAFESPNKYQFVERDPRARHPRKTLVGSIVESRPCENRSPRQTRLQPLLLPCAARVSVAALLEGIILENNVVRARSGGGK